MTWMLFRLALDKLSYCCTIWAMIGSGIDLNGMIKHLSCICLERGR
jgi:hypothetical protein